MTEEYKVYRKKISFADYFNLWEEEKVEQLTDSLMKDIYNKYLVKCDVFTRDKFKCRSLNCKSTNSGLTIHHVKWKKNGGKDSVRNCVTVCDSCHKAYHRAKRDIVLPSDKTLPSHMIGMTYSVHKDDSIDWKVVKKVNKQLRKEMRSEFTKANWDIIAALMRWLEM